MTTPVSLPLFTVQEYAEAFVSHDSTVSGGDPTIQPISALVHFTPVDVRGKTLTEVVIPDSVPPMTVRLRPITGRLDTDGKLRTMNGEPVYYQDGVTRNPVPQGATPVMADDGRTPAYWITPEGTHIANPSGTPVFGVRLIANSDQLGVPGGILNYRVTYSGTVYDAQKDIGVNEFVFAAATTDITLDLGTVARINEFNTVAVPAVVDNVSAALTAWRADISGFDARVITAETEVGDLSTNLTAAATDISSLQTWRTSASSELSTHETRLNTAENGLATVVGYAAHKIMARTAIAQGKIKGGNVTVKPNGGSWSGMWSEWDWAHWIQPQIDRIKIAGGNAIRIIGAPEVVFNPATVPSQLNQAQYDARWAQIAEYCLEQGMRIYPSIVTEWAFHGYTGAPNNFQDATVTASILTTAAALAKYENVIGFDVWQEAAGSVSSGLAYADFLVMYAAIRSVAPGVPLTTSNSTGGFGTPAGFWTDTTSIQAQLYAAVGGVDFIDLHVYLTGVNAADLDGFIQRTGKPVLIGEYGTDQTLSAANQLARYESGRVLHQRTGVLGSFFWAAADQGTSAANQDGIWDNTGFSQPTWPTPASTSPLSLTSGQRTALVNKFQQFGIAAIPAAITVPDNKFPAAVARAISTTAGWAQGANTSLFSDPRGVGIAVITASVGSPANAFAGPSAKIPVNPSTPYWFSAWVVTSVASRTVTMSVDWYDINNNYLVTSTSVTGAGGANNVTPSRLTGLVTSHASAAYAVPTVHLVGATANNESLVVVAGKIELTGL